MPRLMDNNKTLQALRANMVCRDIVRNKAWLDATLQAPRDEQQKRIETMARVRDVSPILLAAHIVMVEKVVEL